MVLRFRLWVAVCMVLGNLGWARAQLGVAKDAYLAERVIGIDFYLENFGSSAVSPVMLTDDLAATFGAGNYVISSPPTWVDNPGTLLLNGSYDGNINVELVTGGTLAGFGTAIIHMEVKLTNVTDQGHGVGVYHNQAHALVGQVSDDLSTDGTDPDPDGNGDPFDNNEPTVIDLSGRPVIGVAKNATLNGQQVTLDFYLENLGDRELIALSLPDDLDPVFGAGNYSILTGPTLVDDPGTVMLNSGFDGGSDAELIDDGSLGVGHTAQIRVVVDILNVVNMGMGVGVYSNQVEVIASALGHDRVFSDLSDAGTEPDANGNGNPQDTGENDPTVFAVGEEPVIGCALDVSVSGDVVTLNYLLENLGTAELENLDVNVDLEAVFGAVNYTLDSGPTLIVDPGTLTLNGGFDGQSDTALIDSGTLATGTVAQIQIQVRVTRLSDVGFGLGNYSHQVTATAQSALGDVTTDLSDDGTDPDPNGNGDPGDTGENDPSLFSVAQHPVIGVSKTVQLLPTGSAFVDVGGVHQNATGPLMWVNLYLENLGNVTISNLSLIDDLNAVFGAGNYGTVVESGFPEVFLDPGTLNVDANYNGSTVTDVLLAGSSLAPQEIAAIRFRVMVLTVTDQGSGMGVYDNSATISGTGPDANMVSDLSDDGTDPDPNGNGDPGDAGEDDPFRFVIGSKIGVAKDAAVVGDEVTLDFYLECFGTQTLTDLSLEDNLNTVFGIGNHSISSAPTLMDDPGTLILNPAFDGDSVQDLLTPGSSLNGGDTAQIRVGVTVTRLSNPLGSGLGQYRNSATVTAMQAGGVQILDVSETGMDPDPNGNDEPSDAGEDSPTAFAVSFNGVVGLALDAAVSGTQVTFDLYMECFGAPTSTDLVMPFDLDAVFGSGNYTLLASPGWIVDPGTLNLNGSFDGIGDTALLNAGSTLAGGATAQLQMVVDVTDIQDVQGLGVGFYEAQVEITGLDGNGVGYSDLSDGGTNPDITGDGDPTFPGLEDPPIDGEDDPTVFLVGTGALGAALHSFVNGNQVTYDYYLENLGDVEVTSISVTHNLYSVYGFGNYSVVSQPVLMEGPSTINPTTVFDGTFVQTLVSGGSLLPGEKARIRFVIQVNTVINGGVYTTQFTASGSIASGDFLTDPSDDGILTDPNFNRDPGDSGENDATLTILGEEPVLGAALQASLSGNEVTLDFTIENLGNVALSQISAAESLDAVFGGGNFSLISGPTWVADPGTITLNSIFDGSTDTALFTPGTSTLAVGSSGQLRMVVDVTTIDDVGLGVGVYENQIMVAGLGPSDTVAQDLSDDGLDPDPNGNGNPADAGESDITNFSLSTQAVGVAKQVIVNGRQATLDYFIGNLGSGPLNDFYLEDDLDAVFGAGNFTVLVAPAYQTPPRDLLLNTDFDGSGDVVVLSGGTMAPGIVEQVRVVVEVHTLADMGSGLGVYTNQVTVEAYDGALFLSDLSDAGSDPDPNGNGYADDAGEDDPTVFTMPQEPLLGVAKTAAVSTRTVTLDFVLESFANLTAEQVSLIEDLDSLFGAGNYSITSGPTLTVNPGGLILNGAYDGSSNTDLLNAGSTFAQGDLAQLQMTVEITNPTDQGMGIGIYQNQITVSASSPDNTVLTDLSDDGTNPDPDGDGNPAEAGEDDATPITLQASLGDFVWNDLNGDGTQDVGESGLSGITVFLDLNGNGSLDAGEPSDSTDAAGAYGFDQIDAGNYTVDVVAGSVPTGFVLITANLPLSVSLFAGEDETTADFGYQQQDASIGDFIWNDLNGDGIQDGAEPGLSGVTVFLDLNGNGTLDGGEPSQVTGGAGAYDFTDLPTGTYQVTVDASTIPAGFVLTGGTEPLTVNLAAGEDFNDADVGYQQQDASIGDFIWNDLNGDGVQDAGEPGLAGVTAFLDLNGNGVQDAGELSDTTDGTGTYDILDLPTGTYLVTVDASTLPAGFVLTGGLEPLTVNLAAGEDFNDADFGYQQQNASIGDFIWNDLNGDGVQDAGEPGLASVQVFLDLNGNGVLDMDEPLGASDASGAYDITGLATGTYAATLNATTIPTGFVLTGGINPSAVALAAGEDFNDADFGFQQQDASIGDFIWNDLNGDGVQDAGEPGLTGVIVFLDTNGNGTPDAGEPVQTTDGLGAYDFTDLPMGTYAVTVDATTVPAGFVLTGGTESLTVNLAAGEDFNDADVGYQQQDASIGDFVWNDLNGDGVQNPGEPALAGVTVFLDSNGNGTPDVGEPVQTTDGLGAYDFTDLPMGTYAVTVDGTSVTVGFVLTGGTNPWTVNLAAGEDFNDADFGYQQQDASIGDFIWNDLNGDGIPDVGEPGLAGISVFLDSNGNGSPDAGEPLQATDGLGAYDLTDLPTGIYAVTVDASSVPTGFVLTGGTEPLTVNLAAGEDFNDADFGYQQQDASIGDFIWNDLNGDGVQDAGEPGLAGISVFFDTNGNGAPDAGEPVQTTDGLGAYDFTDLPMGTYAVTVDVSTVPTGFVLTGGTELLSVNLAAGEDFNDADVGYQQQDASIGDFIWNDLNGDSIQDAGEPGLAGISVFFDTNGNGAPDVGEPLQTTDGAGAFDFTDLPTGTYLVTVDEGTVTPGFVLTGGTNPLTVNLAAGEDFNNADFGYQQQDASIGDFIWDDLNSDGIQDAGEPGLSGIDVFLDTNGNGSPDAGEPLQTTDAAGAYDFTDLPTGTYAVTVDSSTVPGGYVLTTGNDPITVNLAAGEDFNDADFGYCLPPTMDTQPMDVHTCPFEPVSFSVSASGAPPLEYQWQLDGADIPGATNATHDIASVDFDQAGIYTCVVRNGCSSVVSDPASLTLIDILNTISATAGQPGTVVITIDSNCQVQVDIYWEDPSGQVGLALAGVMLNGDIQEVVVPDYPDVRYFLDLPGGDVVAIQGLYTLYRAVPTLGFWGLLLLVGGLLTAAMIGNRSRRC